MLFRNIQNVFCLWRVLGFIVWQLNQLAWARLILKILTVPELRSYSVGI